MVTARKTPIKVQNGDVKSRIATEGSLGEAETWAYGY